MAFLLHNNGSSDFKCQAHLKVKRVVKRVTSLQHQSNIFRSTVIKGQQKKCAVSQLEYEWKVQRVEDEMISTDKSYFKQNAFLIFYTFKMTENEKGPQQKLGI